jgi:integrase
MDAMTTAPFKYLLQNEYGKPFTVAGIGMRFQEWRNAAGLHHCSLHGLRKARARQLAEAGASDAMGMAHLGQKKSETFAHYRAAADREGLSDAGADLLEKHLHKGG